MFESGVNDGLHMVICQGVEDILSFSSSLDQIGQPEDLQLMGDGGLGDAEKSGQVADAQFPNQEGMEELSPGAIAAEFEEDSHLDVLRLRRHLAPHLFHRFRVKLLAL